MMSKNHYYFFLPSNSFALLSSLSFLNLLANLIFFFKLKESGLFLVSVLFLSFSGFLWWFSYSLESGLYGYFNSMLDAGLKFSFVLFICSEIFFFFSFFWSYFTSFLCPCFDGSFYWPPFLVTMFEFDKLPFVNTLILLSSGVSVTISHYFLVEGKKFSSEIFLLITIFLGFLFSFYQLSEYQMSFFSLNDGSFGSVFFILTGFHGIHVLIGSFYLMVVLLKSVYNSNSSDNMTSFELASWYWHFVDVIWVFLFYLIYYYNF